MVTTIALEDDACPHRELCFAERFRCRGACDEPEPFREEQFPTAVEDDAPPLAAVVRTIALEEDAPRPLGLGGDDDCLEEDAPSSLLDGGDDDCVGGGCSVGFIRRW